MKERKFLILQLRKIIIILKHKVIEIKTNKNQ